MRWLYTRATGVEQHEPELSPCACCCTSSLVSGAGLIFFLAPSRAFSHSKCCCLQCLRQASPIANPLPYPGKLHT